MPPKRGPPVGLHPGTAEPDHQLRNNAFTATGPQSDEQARSTLTNTTIRHTAVSLLLDLGVPPHVLREIAGHSAIEVTMDVYTRAPLGEKTKALKRLGKRSTSGLMYRLM
ncbi:hypothetical protein DQ384_36295 [Sphaerisporangium album]|uniref:Uncharacterized protein n=1 Tax=Sphaerisporangium album TaxID=509200 RepID=A0A367EW57_9ACTN|nr:tyrosine-type recombinase/integrase [Sphaerisporangium album]RCG21929.1 hypothetical protein DQ384_36295 [Sphaerisporangium album]